MLAVIIICVAATILVLVGYMGVKFVQSSKPRGFAYQMAKTQLNCYRRLKYNDEYANYNDEDMFKVVLSKRHGYGAKEISIITNKAKEMARYDKKKPDFRDFVMQLVLFDYERRIGYVADGITGELASGVFKAIPD